MTVTSESSNGRSTAEVVVPDPTPASLLGVTDVTKSFGGVQAARGITLSVHHGEVLGLIGPNGAGKTTLVNLITGYAVPTSGSVVFDGKTTVGVPPHVLAERGLARTFQHVCLFEGSTVLQNVLIGRHLAYTDRRWNLWQKRRREERKQDEIGRGLLGQVGLSAYADDDVTQLPYGLRRRVEIARALAVNPHLLLLDEPTAGMTRRESDEIGALITDLNTSGVTVLLVDHNVRLVSDVCHRVAVMDWGQIITDGRPNEVWNDQRVKDAYLGIGRNGRASGRQGGA